MPTHPESQRIRSNECNGWSTRGKKAGDRPKNRAKAVEATSSTRAKKPKLLLQVDSTGNALRKQLFNILKIKTLIKASWWCCQMDIQMKRTHTHTLENTHTSVIQEPQFIARWHITSDDQLTNQEHGNITTGPSTTKKLLHTFISTAQVSRQSSGWATSTAWARLQPSWWSGCHGTLVFRL